MTPHDPGQPVAALQSKAPLTTPRWAAIEDEGLPTPQLNHRAISGATALRRGGGSLAVDVERDANYGRAVRSLPCVRLLHNPLEAAARTRQGGPLPVSKDPAADRIRGALPRLVRGMASTRSTRMHVCAAPIRVRASPTDLAIRLGSLSLGRPTTRIVSSSAAWTICHAVTGTVSMTLWKTTGCTKTCPPEGRAMRSVSCSRPWMPSSRAKGRPHGQGSAADSPRRRPR